MVFGLRLQSTLPRANRIEDVQRQRTLLKTAKGCGTRLAANCELVTIGPEAAEQPLALDGHEQSSSEGASSI
ncbi:MAG: hypothetical protein DMG64_05335 [Acidobacteria bacterium]|nr:MAG: hypothetical protein DMG64_05335 [Acidobacteriota bacterium]